MGCLDRDSRNVRARGRVYRRARSANGVGLDPALWIDWEGPLIDQWPPKLHQQMFFKGEVADEERNDEYAREIITCFTGRAFRSRKVIADFRDCLLQLYRDGREQGDSFEEALKEPREGRQRVPV